MELSGGAAGAFGGEDHYFERINGAAGVLISEITNIAGGTFIGSQDSDTAIILLDSDNVTIDGNANISGNILISGDNTLNQFIKRNTSGSVDFYNGTSGLSVIQCFQLIWKN